jgi:hypothetical protein
MATKVRITSDFPTQADVASRLRISPARVAELRRQLLDVQATQPNGTAVLMPVKRVPETKIRTGVASTRSKKK